MKEFHNESAIARKFVYSWLVGPLEVPDHFEERITTAIARLLREAHKAGEDSLLNERQK